MKKLGILLVAAFACLNSAVADEASWLTDLSKAQSAAKQDNKLVLMDFTGSDWCPPCKALHKNVLTSKEFEEFAKDKLVLVLVDFPNQKQLPAEQKKANDALLKKYSVGSFPTIIILDSAGKQLGLLEGYRGESPKDFIAKVKEITAKAS
jgi:thioredoxin-related protein